MLNVEREFILRENAAMFPLGHVIDSVIARDINDLEPRLTRYGYSVKTLAGVLHVRQNVVKSFLRGQLPPGQTQEIQNEMLALGIPL